MIAAIRRIETASAPPGAAVRRAERFPARPSRCAQRVSPARPPGSPIPAPAARSASSARKASTAEMSPNGVKSFVADAQFPGSSGARG